VNGRDPHSALKSDVIHRISKDGAEFVLARLQYGKTDIQFSLHASPNTFSTNGLQTTDFLSILGFQRSDQCPFASLHRCYVKWVTEDFQIGDFANAFSSAFTHLSQAEQGLNACGFILPGTKAMPISAMGQARARIGDHDCYLETVTPHKKSRE
jgi:hypothetical protein